eukprot:1989120-Pyramimonas_sp.AAC.1
MRSDLVTIARGPRDTTKFDALIFIFDIIFKANKRRWIPMCSLVSSPIKPADEGRRSWLQACKKDVPLQNALWQWSSREENV